jgi:hypothetical protein
MRLTFFIVGLILFISARAQDKKITKEDTYKIYSNFVGGKWETKGTWKSGAAFHQDIVVEPELTKNIFTVKTHDYIDSKKYDHVFYLPSSYYIAECEIFDLNYIQRLLLSY